MKLHRNGTPPHRFGLGDVAEVTEGTLVAAVAAVVVYFVHQRFGLPPEIESAVGVVVYAGVRAVLRYWTDTTVGPRVVDEDKTEETNEGESDADAGAD